MIPLTAAPGSRDAPRPLSLLAASPLVQNVQAPDLARSSTERIRRRPGPVVAGMLTTASAWHGAGREGNAR